MGQDPLAQLRDIRLPEPVAIWPPAPGWWLLAIAFLALLAWGLFDWRRRKRQQAYRKVARQALQTAYSAFRRDDNSGHFIHQCHTVLRRAALQRYPEQRATISPLVGSAWLEFLDSCCEQQVFGERLAQEVGQVHYQSIANENSAAAARRLYKAATRWLDSHR